MKSPFRRIDVYLIAIIAIILLNITGGLSMRTVTDTAVTVYYYEPEMEALMGSRMISIDGLSGEYRAGDIVCITHDVISILWVIDLDVGNYQWCRFGAAGS